MSLPTTILVSETEMRSGFAKVVSAEKLQKDSASYSFLYTLAGKEVGTGEIIGAITRQENFYLEVLVYQSLKLLMLWLGNKEKRLALPQVQLCLG